MFLTLLILAVGRTCIICEPSEWPRSPRVSQLAQLLRAASPCTLYGCMEDQGLDSCWGISPS